jgi:hypothetical protein
LRSSRIGEGLDLRAVELKFFFQLLLIQYSSFEIAEIEIAENRIPSIILLFIVHHAAGDKRSEFTSLYSETFLGNAPTLNASTRVVRAPTLVCDGIGESLHGWERGADIRSIKNVPLVIAFVRLHGDSSRVLRSTAT